MSFSQAHWEEPLLNDIDAPAIFGFDRKIKPSDCGTDKGPLERKTLNLPNVSERYLMKHYVNLSQMNYSVDNGPHLLGSCTMKYNPKVSENIASLEKAVRIHPLQPVETVQGTLRVMYELSQVLAKISGMDAVSLQPAGGAQGEFAGMLITRAYFEGRGENRNRILVPDSAHGTNPASAAMAGFEVTELPSRDGMVDVELLKKSVNGDVAAIMLTNPNTLGLFEERVGEIADIVHGKGGLLYYDGANMNAIVGKTNPGAMGFDIVHFNLHKTFATPHGGGGPGAGPIGVKRFLEKFLPVPAVVFRDGTYDLDFDRPESIGKLHSFYGNFGILLRAYAYILLNGRNGLVHNSETAVLNSNYLMKLISSSYSVPYKSLKKHEFVASASKLKSERGISAMDVSKRLIDSGIHPPTVYFPQIVNEALMIEPTENLSKETLDEIARSFIDTASEPAEVLHSAPHSTGRRRIDEVKAARDMVFTWKDLMQQETLSNLS